MTRSSETPLDARMISARLGIARSTLSGWLAADEGRPLAQRRFNFHVYHGRKRLWSETGFQALKTAIEIESEPGCCRAAWRRGKCCRDTSTREMVAATDAMLRVLGYYDDTAPANRPKASAQNNDDDVQSTANEVQQCAPR